MTSSLDMSLDDIIKKNKRSEGYSGNFRGGRSRGRGGGGAGGGDSGLGVGGRSNGPGPSRRFSNRPPVRSAPYSVRQAVQVPEAVWPTGALMGGGESSTDAGTKLYISNLDYGVSNDDIQMLFSDVGDLKRHSLHYDKSGRSKGTAEVVFHHQADALAAIKRYNGVQLDGKPMNIELVGVNLVAPAVLPPITNSILGVPQGNFRRGQNGVAHQGWSRGGGQGGRGHDRGAGRGRGRSEKVSAEDLDADLDKYLKEAMQTS